MEAFAIPFLLFVGALLAVQAAANVQLSTATGSPFGASTLQLGIGATLLLAAAAVAGSLDAFGGLDRAEPWQLIGGLGSAVSITSGILLFPRLGAVLTVGLWISGQMLASLLLDGFGWLGVDAEPLGPPGSWAVFAVLIGAALMVRAQAERGAPAGGLGSAAAGSRSPCWPARRSRSRARSTPSCDPSSTRRSRWGRCRSSSRPPAWVLLLAASLSLADAPPPAFEPLRRMPSSGWLGGLAGALYVTAIFSLIPEIGAAPTIALTVGGQQAASVLVDRFGSSACRGGRSRRSGSRGSRPVHGRRLIQLV